MSRSSSEARGQAGSTFFVVTGGGASIARNTRFLGACVQAWLRFGESALLALREKHPARLCGSIGSEFIANERRRRFRDVSGL